MLACIFAGALFEYSVFSKALSRFKAPKEGLRRPEMELEAQWQEHDMGTHPTIRLDLGTPYVVLGASWENIERWEAALTDRKPLRRCPRGPFA